MEKGDGFRRNEEKAMLCTIRKAVFGRKKTLSRSSFIPAAGFSYGNSRLWGQWTKTVASIFTPTRKKNICCHSIVMLL